MPPVYAGSVITEDPHGWLEPDGAEAGTRRSTADHADASATRLCARVGCGAVAVATLTADYAGRQMAVGPLSPHRTPPALDLCARHRAALTPPEGWELLVHEPARESPDRSESSRRGAGD